MEEQKRRAEADKLAAITALAKRSKEFMQEKEAKRKLEQRIASMQSQLLIGGNKIEETQVFRSEFLDSNREVERGGNKWGCGDQADEPLFHACWQRSTGEPVGFYLLLTMSDILKDRSPEAGIDCR